MNVSTQLRAILRASAFGPIHLLIPMLSHAFEIDQSLLMIEQAKAQLREAKKKFDAWIKIGAMIEIPAAALTLPLFIKRLDFLSIGTNDLIQYTLAIDRVDHEVAHLYNPLHPAVLQLVSQTISRANRAGVPVAVCGEMAGDPLLTNLLLGMGLRQFSMHPAQLLAVKQEVLRADTAPLALLGWLSGQTGFYEGLGVTPNMAAPNDALALLRRAAATARRHPGEV